MAKQKIKKWEYPEKRIIPVEGIAEGPGTPDKKETEIEPQNRFTREVRGSQVGFFKELTVGAGTNIFKASIKGIWLGATNFDDGVFKATPAGAITASNFTLSGRTRVHVYRETSVQSIPNSVVTKIQFNAEHFDDQNEFDSTTNYNCTVSTAGKYLIIAQARYAAVVADKIVSCYIYKNNAVLKDSPIHTSHTGAICARTSALVTLAANDYIDIRTFHNFGGATDLSYGTQYTFLLIFRVV